MEKQKLLRLGVVVVWLGYCGALCLIGIAIASSPWFSFQYNWLSDLGNSNMSLNYVGGIPVTYIFNSSLILGGIAGMFFSYTLFISETFSTRKGKVSVILFFLAMVFVFLTGIFSEDYGKIHGIVALTFFFLVPISLLSFSFSFEGWERLATLIVSVCSLAAFALLFVDRPWGSNAVVELIPCAALGVEFVFLSRKMLVESRKGKEN